MSDRAWNENKPTALSLSDRVVSRRLALAWIGGCAIASGCRPASRSAAAPETVGGEPRTPLSLQLNWYPEAEHGGFYAADVEGYYDEAALEVEIRPGGMASTIASELELGRADFAVANAEDVVLFRQQGADVVAVMTAAQDHPRCIMVRADSGVESFEDLQGMTLQCQPGRPYLEFLRQRGLLEGVQEVPYHGTVAQLVASPKVAQQAYVFAEPLLAEQQGVEVRTLMVSDLGFNPYSSVLLTTGKTVRERPELVRQMVQASIRGWRRYLDQPAAANARILEVNDHGMTSEALAYGVEKLRPLCLPAGMPSEQLGQMTDQRWQRLVEQMVELGLASPERVTAEACYSREFLAELG